MTRFSPCFFTFIQIFLVLLSLFHLTLAGCHDNERYVLLQFKQSLVINHSASGDPSAYPKVASWNSDNENSNCCLWDGIKCHEDTGHIIKLDLSSSFLYGSINSSSSLFHLVHLQWLSLADNHFNSSSIPSRIMSLTSLSYLNLSYSVFSGQIPSEILQLSQLVFLDVSQNHLELRDPSLTNLVEKLLNLKVLDLSEVNISSSIPPALTNLSSLNVLSFSGCGLQGTLSSSIGNLIDLLHLDISYNNLKGTLSSSIGNLTNLLHLDISYNNLKGTLSSSIGNLNKLLHLDISFNSFEGESLTFIGNLTQLSYLAISNHSYFGRNPKSLSWIRSLEKLTHLDFSDNNITGEIPSVFMNLTQLTVLHLFDNQLTGPIPSWLTNMNKLSDLRLHSNQLTGHIPLKIGNLTQLKCLSLGANRLEGTIPSSIFELKNLERLYLFLNYLSGTVHLNMFLANLKSLYVLLLSSNKLSLLTRTTVNTSQKFIAIGFSSCNLSEFPRFLHNQDRLRSLDLSFNKIAGQVPGWFLNVSTNSLQYLNLSSNLLTSFNQNLSSLPWVAVTILDLRFNKLQGPLPVPSMSTYSYLVSDNQLIGEISPKICNLYGLHALDLSYNNFTGMLPECLGNFSYSLTILKLQGNNFHGSIPQNFVNQSNLAMIDLSNNALQGRIPQSLGNCLKLKFLNVGDNQITDIFPSWLGNLPELEVLILKSNKFYGIIKEPKDGFEFPKLHIIDLSHNRFTGNLPSKYFQNWNAMKNTNARKLVYLEDKLWPYVVPVGTVYGSFDYSLTLSNKGTHMEYQKLSNLITAIILSNNEFIGEIPTSIANLKGLRTLNLSDNNLEGHIPSSLNNLIMLESLDLSNNKLSGEIPQQLGELTTLAVFDVSHNHLTGRIPQGTQFTTFNLSSFDGNPGLCGEPLLRKCEKSENSREEDPHSESLFAFGWKIVLIGYASGTIIGVVLGQIFSIRKQEWLAKTFRLQLKSFERKGRDSN
ncbi:Receptor-like protein [Melia azedarach]|uniref:Receptor-like protein n=1 Tax=Melia azedarach TaxID=155640 RepID=A0ACC1YZX1_MELAZ|nr:Receptor-like protein [Melia azedarach]